MTEEEFFHKFFRDEYVSSLVRLNIINELKTGNEKLEGESDQEYHNRKINSKIWQVIENETLTLRI